MKFSLLSAGLFPHAPIMLPAIGGKEIEKIPLTESSVNTAGQMIADENPDTLVVITPHNLVFQDGASILIADSIKGSMKDFGHEELSMTLAIDREFSEAIYREASHLLPIHRIDEETAAQYGCTLSVDWGTFVPLYHILSKGCHAKVVLLTPYFGNFSVNKSLGELVVAEAARLGRKISVIASGDLSHRLTPDAPYGYTKNGIVFDNIVMDALEKRDLSGLDCLSKDFLDDIAACGTPFIYFLHGALSRFETDNPVRTHEGPFGVGYGVSFYIPKALREIPEETDSCIRLARESIMHYFETGSVMKTPDSIPENMKSRHGVFVTLHKWGALRGCIGTFLPTTGSVAEEIIQNAVSSATRDPRFPAVTIDEMKDIRISVDVLSTPEPVSSSEELDPDTYGVIVEWEHLRGLLLPHLEGVDTVEQQIAIAKRKAGIPEDIIPQIYRFEVVRHE